LLPAIGNSGGDLAPTFLFFFLFSFLVLLSVARWGSFVFYHRQQRGSFNPPTSSFFLLFFHVLLNAIWSTIGNKGGTSAPLFCFFSMLLGAIGPASANNGGALTPPCFALFCFFYVLGLTIAK
jgi:hypothetical protein